jgi:hypothetical protein
MNHPELVWLLLLPLVAGLYASVGHGGASGYLALMALLGVSPQAMRPSALLLNLFVAGISFWQYRQQGHFRLRLFAMFAVASMPMAFLGGSIEANPFLYKRLLALGLLLAVARLLGMFGGQGGQRQPSFAWGLPIGGAIGFFSGLIGIGGGIVLSPVLLLLRWATAKEAAAVSALFIWANSATGLAGQVWQGLEWAPELGGWAVLAVLGGLAGSWLGSRKWSDLRLRQVLACVLALASAKLLLA